MLNWHDLELSHPAMLNNDLKLLAKLKADNYQNTTLWHDLNLCGSINFHLTPEKAPGKGSPGRVFTVWWTKSCYTNIWFKPFEVCPFRSYQTSTCSLGDHRTGWKFEFLIFISSLPCILWFWRLQGLFLLSTDPHILLSVDYSKVGL